jgi:hypothetical protein
VAGPWFTVETNGADWKKLSEIWISDGNVDCRGTIEIRLKLEASDHVI